MIPLRPTDMALIFAIILAAGAICAACVFALVRNVPPDDDERVVEERRERQRGSHPEVE